MACAVSVMFVGAWASAGIWIWKTSSVAAIGGAMVRVMGLARPNELLNVTDRTATSSVARTVMSTAESG